MAIISTTITGDMLSNAGFRAWATAFSNMFSGHWVQTADTGQIDLGVVTLPGTTYTSIGYQIWRMNDSLQATMPCYLRVDYSTGEYSTYAHIIFTVGTGTDGAGTITLSNGGTPFRFGFNSQASSATGFLTKGSVDTNRICFKCYMGSSNYCFTFCIERTHNSVGADTSAGIMVFFMTQSTCPELSAAVGASSFVISPTTATPNYQYWNIAMPLIVTSAAFSNSVFTFPIRTWGQGETSPSLNLTMYFLTDLTSNNVTPITLWDSYTHNMLPQGTPIAGVSFGSTSSNTAIAMRYE